MKTNRILGLCALALVGLIYFVPLAFAQDVATQNGSHLHVDLSSQVTWLLSAMGTLATGLIATGIGLLPGPARWALQVTQIDQVINRAIQAWISKNAAHLATQANWTLDMRSAAVAGVSAMAVNSGNKFVNGVKDELATKVHARLEDYIRKNYQ